MSRKLPIYAHDVPKICQTYAQYAQYLQYAQCAQCAQNAQCATYAQYAKYNMTSMPNVPNMQMCLIFPICTISPSQYTSPSSRVLGNQ